MITLYQRETCPYCKPIREKLTELQITYVNVNLPKERTERKQLIALTGSCYIPALIDDNVVIPGQLENCQHILEYLNAKYGSLKEAHG